jgi:hypothetical protein
MSSVPRYPPGTRWPIKEVKIKEAMDVLKQRGVKHDNCPRCEALDWNVDLIDIPAESSTYASFLNALAPPPSAKNTWGSFSALKSQTGVMSLMAVVCRNCGYTMFHNLEILGISVK